MSLDLVNKARKQIRLHVYWLLYRVVGPEYLSPEELAELEELNVADPIDMPYKAYVLGRLKSQLKSSEYKDIVDLEGKETVDTADPSLSDLRSSLAMMIRKLGNDLEETFLSKYSNHLEKQALETVSDVDTGFMEKQSLFQAISSFGKMRAGIRKDWSTVVENIFHKSKIRGIATAIARRIGKFSKSKGDESFVSIVPKPGTCPDCAVHFLDIYGNPKILRLKDLLQAGTNMTRATNHSKKKGVHQHWVTTLPPLHNRCQCDLVFIPPGTEWVNGKLQVVNRTLFDLSKAVDKTSLSGTVSPQGPNSTNTNSTTVTKPAKGMPSMAGTGKPKGIKTVEWEYWSGEGSPSPELGYMQSQETGAWRRPKGAGGKPGTPEHEEAKRMLLAAEAIEWGTKTKPDAVVLDHLENGEIAEISSLPIEAVERGINESSLITIRGNGRGVMKPPPRYPDDIYVDGIATVPKGSHARNEQAAYKLFTFLGLDLCGPTTTRSHEGVLHSVQKWEEGSTTVSHKLGDDDKKGAASLIDIASDPEGMKNSLFSLVTTDILMNSNDRHMNNIVTKEAGDSVDEVKAIDHGATFANGLMGYKNTVHKDLQAAGYKVKIPGTLKERLETSSLGDFKRALGAHTSDWQVGQTFLRAQYMLHLQEQDGFLDYKKLLPCRHVLSDDEGSEDHNVWGPYNEMWYGTSSEKQAFYSNLKDNRQRGFEQFEDFMMDFIDKAASDSSHPHHESAKELAEIGLFMPPDSMRNPAKYRAEGKHKAYEQKLREKRKSFESLQEKPNSTEELPLSTNSGKTSAVASTVAVPKTEVAPRPKAAELEATKRAKFRKSLYIDIGRHE